MGNWTVKGSVTYIFTHSCVIRQKERCLSTECAVL